MGADSVVSILQQRARSAAGHIAYSLHQHDAASVLPMTFEELDCKARAIGAVLQEKGAKGERALLLQPFGLDFIAAFYGCLYAGVVAVPLYPPRPNRLDARLSAVVADAQPAFALTTAKVLQTLGNFDAWTPALQQMQWLATDTIAPTSTWRPEQPAPDQLAFLQYTSGSTGLPKGVMVSHANVMHNAAMIYEAFDGRPQHTLLMWTPFFHDMGLIGGVVLPIYSGCKTALISPIDFLQQPSHWLQTISRERITVSGGPNFAYELCVEKITPEQCVGLDLSCWEAAFCGAEPVRANTLERFAAKFAPYGFRAQAFTPCFGMAESTLMATCTPKAQASRILDCDGDALAQHQVVPAQVADLPNPAIQRIVSCGPTWQGQTVHIVDPQRMTLCPPDQVGEIWLAGPSVAGGYWQRPVETAETFGATLADSGDGPFLRTGDLGFLHQGELFVTGRIKDLIIIRGRNYYPQDIELTVEQAHPALRRSFVAAFSIERAQTEQLVVVQEIERTRLKGLPVAEVVSAIRRAVAAEHELQVHTIVLLRPGRIAMTTSGKIQRQATKHSFLNDTLEAEHCWSLDAQTATTAVTPAPPMPQAALDNPELAAIVTDLRSLVAQLLRIDFADVDPQQPLLDHGADSIALMEALRQIETRYALKIPLQRAFTDLNTIAALAEYIGAKLVSTEPRRILPVGTSFQEDITAARTVDSNGDANDAMRSLRAEIAQQLLAVINMQLDLLQQINLAGVAQSSPAVMRELIALLGRLDQLALMASPTSLGQDDGHRTNSHTGNHHEENQSTPTAQTTSLAAALPLAATLPPAAEKQPPGAPLHIPLTEAQHQLWFLSQLSDEASMAYNESVSLYLDGTLNLPALYQAIQALVDRHEALRIVIDSQGQEQQILPSLAINLPIINLSTHAGGQTSAVDAWLTTESRRPVDLSTGPLLRVSLLKLAADRHLLVMTAHHIIVDGLSMIVLAQDLSALYNAALAKRTAALPAPKQFSQYIAWQAAHRQSSAMSTQEAYWLEQLKGDLPVLELPLDRQRPPMQRYEGGVVTMLLDHEVTSALKALSKQQGVTLFMTLFAAYTLLLHRLSGQEEVIVGIPAAGRAMAGSERLVGYCAHLLPIRHALVGNPSFGELLHTLRNILLDAYAHQDYPFARLVNKLNVGRDLSLSPIVSSTFNLMQQFTLPTFTGLTTSLGPRPTSFVDREFGVNMVESGGALTVDFEYNSNLFDVATVQRIASHFETLVRALVAAPHQPVAALPLLTAAERKQLLVDWNETSAPFDMQAGYHQLFERQVAETPNAVAVRFEEQTVTYAELNQLANGIAHQLRAVGVGVDCVVALLCERSPLFLAAMLAIFKAGGAYLPLDLRAPASRWAQMLGQSQSKLLLATANFSQASAEALAALSVDVRPELLQLETLATASVKHENLPMLEPTENGGSRLAYVIYTSGSTGLPKGAMVEQRGMNNHIYAKIGDLGLTAADTVAQTAPQSFDISVWQFLCPLLVGGRVCIFPDEVAADPVALLRQTAAEGITVLEVVPSLLRMMVDELASGLPVQLHKLRWMIPTGEALPPHLARQWLHHCPQIPLVNAYGPTECSDDVTHYFVTEPPAASVVNMPIGRPLMNMRMYILDAYGQPVPIGVAGELYVGGVGVGRGYIHDAERTAQAFVADPFSQEPQARLYKTGDKARYLPDGNIEYLGRLDYQVKIRGFRIELGEIEATLEQHPGVYQAIVMDQPDATGNKRLVAYIAPNAQVASADYAAPDDEAGVQPLTTSALRAFLGAKLPDYMVPSMFVILEQMPLTPNGKVDRKALPAPDFSHVDDTVQMVSPRTETEEKLVHIWSDVLNVPAQQIGIYHNFFALGGHSLLATRVALQIRKTFMVELPLQLYFTEPTIADLANHIELTTWAVDRSAVQTAPTSKEEEGEI